MKKMLFIIGATIILSAADTSYSQVFSMNVNASGQDYNNAKLAYCSSSSDRIGCKGALGRTCENSVFCK